MIQRIDEVRGIDAHVDIDVLLEAARSEAEEVLLFSDRAPAGVIAELFGATGKNIGFVAFSATDSEVFARIVNHGPTRAVPLVLVVDEEKKSLGKVDLQQGETVWSRNLDLSAAERVGLLLETGDHFFPDDVVVATFGGFELRTRAVIRPSHVVNEPTCPGE